MNRRLSLIRWLAGHWQKVRRRLDPPYFRTRDVRIGKGVRFGRNVEFNCNRVRIGDGCIFMDNIVINAEVFEIGDFGTVYSGVFVPGPGTLRIGHNVWVGKDALIDAMGGTEIGDNSSIGAGTQLWTHHILGDLMAGCRFHSIRSMSVGKDVWIGAACIVSPAVLADQTLVLAGSLLTKDTLPNTVYAGSPAVAVSEKMGPQFRATSLEERRETLEAALRPFRSKVRIVTDYAEAATDARIVLNIADRTYQKRGTRLERKLIRFLLPDFKFVPSGVGFTGAKEQRSKGAKE